jgi:hypothetical protein
MMFVFFARYYLNDKVKEYWIAGTCSMGRADCVKNPVGKMKGRNHTGDPDMEG